MQGIHEDTRVYIYVHNIYIYVYTEDITVSNCILKTLYIHPFHSFLYIFCGRHM
jgi:hypothetical protein